MEQYMDQRETKYALQVLDAFKQQPFHVNCTQFVRVRNFLIVMLVVCNGARAGNLINLQRRHITHQTKAYNGQVVYSVLFV